MHSVVPASWQSRELSMKLASIVRFDGSWVSF